MKFGINIAGVFSTAKNLAPLKRFTDIAILSEELGYDGFFIPDHLNLPSFNESIEPFTTLAYIAAKTEKIKLGTHVTPVPRYSPPQLAKIISHLDHLSGGRVIPGFGAGWHPDEFYTYAPNQNWDNPSVRVRRTIEGIRLILKLWTEDNVTFNGKYYSVKNAILEPKPLQKPHPPIWSGGSGEYMLKMTAKYFDGWVPVNWSWTNSGDTKAENYSKQMRKLQSYLRKYKRDTSKFTFAVQAGITDSLELVNAYCDAGCNYYIPFIGYITSLRITPWSGYPFCFSPDQYSDLTRKFAQDVMSSFI